MTIPTIGLSALVLNAPALPGGVTTISIDTEVLALSVLADINTTAVDVLIEGITTTLTTYTAATGGRLFTGSAALSGDATTVQVSGRNYDLTSGETGTAALPMLTPTISFDLLPFVSDYSIIVSPPSGITSYKGATSAKVEWALPTMVGFQGVLVEWSTDRTGVNVPFQQYGGLVTEVTRTATVPISSNTVVSSVADPTNSGVTNVVTTTTGASATVPYSSVEIPYTLVSTDQFYVRLSVLVQDTSTNIIFQSQYAGPVLAGFVNLNQVNPTDFLALQRSTDIASRLITEVIRRTPKLDLTSRAETRDTIINPVAIELANMSVRAWFAECSRSTSAMSQIDDANGDGVSDPVANSTLKQQIAQAYGLSNADCQTYIDKRFDILGERAGLPRGGSTTATVPLTFFMYTQPSTAVPVSVGTSASSQATPTVDSVSFVTTASGIIDPISSYDATNGWWAVTLPAQCTTAGSAGAVGVGAVDQLTQGPTSGLAVTNLVPSDNGTDQQSNADYAAAIDDYEVTGKDSSSRGGYRKIARSIPGVTGIQIVGANDLEMVRDWDPLRNKHIYGCVDIYLRGNTTSQQTEQVPFVWPSASTYGTTSTYLSLSLTDATNLKFSIVGFNALSPLYTVVEIIASNVAGSLYLGTAHAQIDNVNGIVALDGAEFAYQLNSDGTTSPVQLGGVNTTNAQMLQALKSQGSTNFLMMARSFAGFTRVPALQPLLAIDSVIGPITGTVAPSLLSLVRTQDFLLDGGSNVAGDTVSVTPTSQMLTKTLILATTQTVIDTDIDVPLTAAQQPGNILSVRSMDLSTLYVFGLDYTIVSVGKYHAYALAVLNDGTTGQPRVALGTSVIAAYKKFPITENVQVQTDTLTLSGTSATSLSQLGFVYNSWLPISHGLAAMALDTGLIAAGVPLNSRYIKVTYAGAPMLEGLDFQLVVTPATGAATIARVMSGGIPDGASVLVEYYFTEVFAVATAYPAYVQQMIAAMADTQAASASVLAKAMVANPVDITILITPGPGAQPTTLDPQIRTVIDVAIAQANQGLTQSTLVTKVGGITGVGSIQLPLVKCAKSDGSYSIGEVIPTGTAWNHLVQDASFAARTLPAGSFITAAAALANPTIPSGGQPNAYVGLLYQGQSYRRAMSVADFLSSTVPSFYFIGTNDSIDAVTPLNSTYSGKVLVTVPSTVATPSLLSFFATYQVYGAAGASDVTTSSTEYLVPGTVTVLYAGAK